MASVTPDAPRFADLTLDWVDGRGRKLSDRIWGNSQRTRAHIDEILRAGIRDGATVDEIASELVNWVRPGIGGGGAYRHATFLARNETRRAHMLSAKDTALADPASGFMRYRLSRTRHITPHDCDGYASHDQGLGTGVWPARQCPLPTVDTHAGCNCIVEVMPYEKIEGRAAIGMDDFVEKLRVEYDLADPPDMSPEDLAIFLRETAQVREDVVFMVRGWLEQTGLVDAEQMAEPSGTVRDWIASVKAAKRRRRAVIQQASGGKS